MHTRFYIRSTTKRFHTNSLNTRQDPRNKLKCDQNKETKLLEQ